MVVVMMVLGCKEPAKTKAQPTPAGSAVADPWAGGPKPKPKQESFVTARAAHRTKLIPDELAKGPLPKPPAPMRLVQYDAPPGKIWAYLTAAPTDGQRHPAIVWITGGNSNEIGDVWTPASPRNDQTARQYPAAGIVTMYPSLRGGHDNPGRREGFFGEVDDVLAAAAFLAKEPYVDPKQIYLGGHSSGGTLVLLVAAAAPANTFRGVIAFGPAESLVEYPDLSPYDTRSDREVELRTPSRWVDMITTPTIVIEGEHSEDNITRLRIASTTKQVKFFTVPGHDHFSVLAQNNQRIASKIVGAWKTGTIHLAADELE